MTIFRPAAAVFAFLLLASCESMSMSGQTIAYNEAVAKSTNEFFLLNVLRARDRFPLYYTRTTGATSAFGATPGVTVGISDKSLTPSATISAPGSNTVSLANLDDQKFMRGILTPVSFATLGFYLDQGWTKEVVLLMLLEKIQLDREFIGKFVDEFNARCRDNPNATYCQNRLPLMPADWCDAPTRIGARTARLPSSLLPEQCSDAWRLPPRKKRSCSKTIPKMHEI
jgi:hypothetical protein